jgi:spore maturation protein SpmB
VTVERDVVTYPPEALFVALMQTISARAETAAIATLQTAMALENITDRIEIPCFMVFPRVE